MFPEVRPGVDPAEPAREARWRVYPDGVVMYDPVDGGTFGLDARSFEIVQLIRGMAEDPWPDPDELVLRVLDELRSAGIDGVDTSETEVSNIRHWVRLATNLGR